MSDTPFPETPVITPFRRDPVTGFVDGKVYQYLPDGRVNWKAMIDPAYIVFNRRLDEELVKVYGAAADKLVYADVIKEKPVDDKHVVILLQGFIELAELRGYLSAPVLIDHVTPGQNVTAHCHIAWVPNVEEPQGKLSSGEADATYENTKGFGYLAAIAGNRAFVRAVRRGLRIPIIGFDEIAEKDTPLPESVGGSSASPTKAALDPHVILEKVCTEEFKITFDLVKKSSLKNKEKFQSDPSEWTDFSSVPPTDCMVVIGLLKKGKEKKAKIEGQA